MPAWHARHGTALIILHRTNFHPAVTRLVAALVLAVQDRRFVLGEAYKHVTAAAVAEMLEGDHDVAPPGPIAQTFLDSFDGFVPGAVFERECAGTEEGPASRRTTSSVQAPPCRPAVDVPIVPTGGVQKESEGRKKSGIVDFHARALRASLQLLLHARYLFKGLGTKRHFENGLGQKKEIPDKVWSQPWSRVSSSGGGWQDSSHNGPVWQVLAMQRNRVI